MSIVNTGVRGIRMSPLVLYDETAFTGFGPVPTPCTVRAFQNAAIQSRSSEQETDPLVLVAVIGGIIWLLSRK